MYIFSLFKLFLLKTKIPTFVNKSIIFIISPKYKKFVLYYCFYQLIKTYKKRYTSDPTGQSPELDAIMVLMMAWVLAPVDASLTWIRMVKKAEEARIRQSKIDLDIKYVTKADKIISDLVNMKKLDFDEYKDTKQILLISKLILIITLFIFINTLYFIVKTLLFTINTKYLVII